MEISNLIIETTRNCNMQCQHCLRGDAQNMNMKKEYIDSLLSQVYRIDSVTFSGGEPSLNVPIMEYFLTECERLNINVGYFYIATNGLTIPLKFIVFCLKMYAYCEIKEECRVDVSNDYYHSIEGDYDIDLLNSLAFFKFKFEKEGYNYREGNRLTLVKEGRSEEGHEVTENSMDCIEDFNNGDIYLNCKGEIINGCDWSYDSQKKHKLCNVSELTVYCQELELVEV